MADPPLLCANCTGYGPNCKNIGKSACSSCRLVVYCSPECQKADWPDHKELCKSDRAKKTWVPEWVQEGRAPNIGVKEGVVLGTHKHLYGDTPAIDILQLASNEGEKYQRDLRLLFAASGDLRDVVKTIAELPKAYNGSVSMVVNDRDIHVVARNVIILLIALIVKDHDEAVECMIHVWYSAVIRQSHLDTLQRVGRRLTRVCSLIQNIPYDMLVAATFTSGKRHLKVTLTKSAWHNLLLFVHVPEGLSFLQATSIRVAVTLDPERVDYRDRHYIFLSPSHRVANRLFRADGVLLPFGASRFGFTKPNPTFFQIPDTWLMGDFSDPLGGWSAKDVEATRTGLATSDIYGKLFYHVRFMIKSFLERISNLNIAIEMLNADAYYLPVHLEKKPFDRIHASNLSDSVYLGIHRLARVMSPLLRPVSINPHATLITLFEMLVIDEMTKEERSFGAKALGTTRRVKLLVPLDYTPVSPFDPGNIRRQAAFNQLVPFHHVFDRAARKMNFGQFPEAFGITTKEKHTIVEKWPFELKLEPEDKGAKEEFDVIAKSGIQNGKERYVEWRKTGEKRKSL